MQKLAPLTTLRFFAAAAIVSFHFEEHCGFINKYITRLDTAVSFFFILSGFILTYVYPSLNNASEIKKFYVARIARIWPAHLFFFTLVCLLTFFGLTINIGNIKTGILNVFLIQSWVPIGKSYFSFNSPSWSISTELFFYLCFPFIINNWTKTWPWKILGFLSIPLFFMGLSTYLQIPDKYTHESLVTGHGLLIINPLSRIVEFSFGMLGAHLWLKYRKWFEINKTYASLLEIISIVFVLINVKYYPNICSFILKYIPKVIHYGFEIWVDTGVLASLSFVLLIMTFASGKGVLSSLFSFPLGVLLGEISFSIYLFHQIIYRFYVINIGLFENLSDSILFYAYWTILLMGSFLSWKLVECPFRNLILNRSQIKQKKMVKIVF